MVDKRSARTRSGLRANRRKVGEGPQGAACTGDGALDRESFLDQADAFSWHLVTVVGRMSLVLPLLGVIYVVVGFFATMPHREYAQRNSIDEERLDESGYVAGYAVGSWVFDNLLVLIGITAMVFISMLIWRMVASRGE